MDAIDPEFLLRLFQTHGLGSLMDGIRLTLERLEVKAQVTNGPPLTTREMQEFAEGFEKMGLPHSADLLRQWATGRGGLPKAEILMPELQRRIQHEIRSVLWLHIPRERRNYYTETRGFGEEVFAAFPSAAYDIEEAGKSFALARYTASVFHLMRMMEISLRVLAKTLNDPRLDPKTNPTWDRILKKCREELEKERSKRAPEWAADDVFFSGAATMLMGVKDAWRNPTLHVEINYDEEKALDVWNHVRGFMRHLATKLSE